MTIIISIHLICALALVGIILLQPGKSDMGVSFGSSSQSIFGSKQAGNFLTKGTTIFAGIYLCTSFLITKIRMDEANKSVVDRIAPAEEKAPVAPVPVTPDKPVEPSKK